jgi:hypothetical protein
MQECAEVRFFANCQYMRKEDMNVSVILGGRNIIRGARGSLVFKALATCREVAGSKTDEMNECI